MADRPRFVLVHSPLVGPYTWEPVAAELGRMGFATAVPHLTDRPGGGPYWRKHADLAVAGAGDGTGGPDIVVGHSGAGPLLAAIGEALERAPAAFIFVDAGLPDPARHSRLAAMEAESAPFARQLRAHLESGGRFPDWSDADLVEVVPDPATRSRLLAGLQPRGIDFFDEPLPPCPGWPPAPCGYLKLSSPYEGPAQRAREAGWPVLEIAAGHFHMLVDPPAVANALLQLGEKLGSTG